MIPSENSSCDSTSATCDLDCPKLTWVFRLLVGAQFLLAAASVLLLTPPWNHGWAAWVMSAGIGVWIWSTWTLKKSLTASPRLKTGAKLQTRGPYGMVRHPMYAALLVFCAGFSIADNSLFGWMLWTSLAVVLLIKIYYEEQILRQNFPEYEAYANKVKRLIPYVY